MFVSKDWPMASRGTNQPTIAQRTPEIPMLEAAGQSFLDFLLMANYVSLKVLKYNAELPISN